MSKKIVCIPRKYLSNLRKGIRDGAFDIAKMMKMSSKQTRAIFEKYLPEDLAKFANTGFERAKVSAKQQAMVEWVNRTFKGKRINTKKDIISKIDKLYKKGILSIQEEENFLEDLVADELGVNISFSELKEINKLASNLGNAKDRILNKYDIGMIEESISPIVKESKAEFKKSKKLVIDYFVEREKMINYIQSINPSSNLRIAMGGTVKLSMLFSVKSPGVNVIANTAMATAKMTIRRLKNKRISGQNGDLIWQYAELTHEIFRKSGYDISRMMSVADDQKILGEKIGEDIISSQGEGRFRYCNRIFENIIYRKALGYVDVLFALGHFGDTANLTSETIAIKEGVKGKESIKARAREIMVDSMNILPTSDEGRVIREEAIKEAFEGTFTNDSLASEVSLGIRKIMNMATGDLRAGDQIVVFAKTPANAVMAGVEHSGVTFPWDMYKLAKGKVKGDTVMMTSGVNGLYKAGLGLVAIFMLGELVDPDDYVSEYADYYPKERQLIAENNATYNSIKIKDGVWFSLDYFGPFASSFVGYMNAKKYGTGIRDKIKRYFIAGAYQATKIPGINEIRETLEKFPATYKKLKKGDMDEVKEEAYLGIADFVAARVVPALVYDMATTLDDYKRKTDTGLSKFLNRIPGTREKLLPKISLFGEKIETEPGINPILFGSRMKYARENVVVTELNRLSVSNELPSISSIEYSSARMKVLKKAIGTEEFNNLMVDFGTNLYTSWEKVIEKKAYQKLEAEEQRKILNKIRGKILDAVYLKYIKKIK